MKVVICGITGLIGKTVKVALEAEGYEVVGVYRDDLAIGVSHLQDVIEGAEAVVNLAGAPVLKKWTKDYKLQIYNSRIYTTRLLVEAINGMQLPPKNFISASAVGIYDEINVHDEFSSNFSSDFMASVCRDWENEVLKLKRDKVCLSIFRLGIVISSRGGALKKMLLPFKFGLGGKLGSGNQYLPWIHLDDVVRAIVGDIAIPWTSGVYNLVAPEVLTNIEFTHKLAKVLHRPAFIKIPEWVLKLVYGEGSKLLISGQQVIPQRILADGFEFLFPTLSSALEKELIK